MTTTTTLTCLDIAKLIQFRFTYIHSPLSIAAIAASWLLFTRRRLLFLLLVDLIMAKLICRRHSLKVRPNLVQLDLVAQRLVEEILLGAHRQVLIQLRASPRIVAQDQHSNAARSHAPTLQVTGYFDAQQFDQWLPLGTPFRVEFVLVVEEAATGDGE